MNGKKRNPPPGTAPGPGGRGLPLFACPVQAGFPSPADDYMEGRLDLNEHLVKHRAATYCLRAQGLSMAGANIRPDDILVVDRSLPPVDGRIVVAETEDGFTVKRLRLDRSGGRLVPENDGFEPIRLDEAGEVRVWGCVTWILHKAW